MSDMHSSEPFLTYRFWKLSCVNYKQMWNSTYRNVYQMPLQYQHILLGYCHSSHPWAISELKDFHLGSTLCLSHQPPSQAHKEFLSSLYIRYQESLNCSSVFLSSLGFSRYLEIPGINPLLTKCFINYQHLHQILRGKNVFEYLLLSLQYLTMCLRN